jgi:hypothetical protein
MNNEIHSLAAVWSSGDPPTTWSLPFSGFTNRASPKMAIVSPSSLLSHELRFNFMRAVLQEGLDIGGHTLAQSLFQEMKFNCSTGGFQMGQFGLYYQKTQPRSNGRLSRRDF